MDGTLIGGPLRYITLYIFMEKSGDEIDFETDGDTIDID